MSFNKIKKINEANLKLEQRYLMREQTQTGATQTGTTQTTTLPPSTTQTTTKSFDELLNCANVDSKKLGLVPGEKKNGVQIFNTKDGKPYCK